MCDRSFTMRRLYDRHMQMHENGITNKAHQDFYTWNETNLIGIPGTEDSEALLLFQGYEENELAEYRCFLCDRVFSTLKGMKGHMTRMHSDEKSGSAEPATVAAAPPAPAAFGGNSNGATAALMLCDLCGGHFGTKEGLMSHLVEAHGTTIVKPEPVADVVTNGLSAGFAGEGGGIDLGKAISQCFPGIIGSDC